MDEITRCGDGTKQAYTDGMLAVVDAVVDVVATEIAPQDPQAARVKLLNVFAMMVGTLQFARALADRALADQVLERGVRDVLTLLEM